MRRSPYGAKFAARSDGIGRICFGSYEFERRGENGGVMMRCAEKGLRRAGCLNEGT
jgi:hypothetical protein